MAPSIACRGLAPVQITITFLSSRDLARHVSQLNGLSCRELQSGGVLFFIVASKRSSEPSRPRYLYNREAGVDVFLSEWIANTGARKHRICGILHACSRSVKFTGCFRSKLGKQIAIGNVCYRVKN